MTSPVKQAIFVAARTLGLFALCRRLSASKLRILCYHGGCIGDESDYNPKLFCSAATFAARMDWLQRKGFTLVTLDEAAASARAGKRAPLTTTITFDDGWYSTASELIPVLAARRIPSTLYLCTSHYLEGWAIPAVTVRYLLWKAGKAQADLHGLGTDIDGHYDLSTPALREQAAERLVAAIERSGPTREARHELLEQLAAALSVSAAQLALDSRRFEYVRREELLALPAQGCAVELHGHVHRYPAGDTAAFERDLAACRAAIEDAGLPTPRHYCYPSGNFDGAASPVLDKLGVRTATTCLPGWITAANHEQLHYLPRFLDGESISMLEFEAEMSGFSELLRKLAGRKAHPLQPD